MSKFTKHISGERSRKLPPPSEPITKLPKIVSIKHFTGEKSRKSPTPSKPEVIPQKKNGDR